MHRCGDRVFSIRQPHGFTIGVCDPTSALQVRMMKWVAPLWSVVRVTILYFTCINGFFSKRYKTQLHQYFSYSREYKSKIFQISRAIFCTTLDVCTISGCYLSESQTSRFFPARFRADHDNNTTRRGLNCRENATCSTNETDQLNFISK